MPPSGASSIAVAKSSPPAIDGPDHVPPTANSAASAGAARWLRPGRNCWRIERAAQIAFLVDGEEYFSAVRAALAQARRSFYILGWDFDTRTVMTPRGAPDGMPETLGPFLNHLVGARAQLHGHVLSWDYAMLYALEREWMPQSSRNGPMHPRLALHFDDSHPLGGSHHQKVIVVDDEVAFVGGFDLTGSRWDTSDHAPHNPLRVTPAGDPYPPFHDVAMLVSGPCAAALGELCRERWRRATGRLAPPRVVPDRAEAAAANAWPPSITAAATDIDVAIIRTEPAFGGRRGVSEMRQLHLDAIAHARRFIFAENQYFTSGLLANALQQRLGNAAAPEMAMLVPAIQSGWLEASTMGVLRARIHRGLRAADPAGRYQLYCPSHACGDVADGCINVHSKVLIVDDEFLTVGSANLSNRSMHLDTECNLAIEAGGDPHVRATIAAFRERLLAEHLGVDAGVVRRSSAQTGSLHATIDALGDRRDRWLQRLEPALDPAIDALTPDHDVLDPERPLDLDVVVSDLLPEHRSRDNVRLRLTATLLGVVALCALALAWRYTALNQYLNLETLIAGGTRIRASAWAPLLVPAIFVLAGLAIVPLTLMIAVTVVVFGPLEGVALALTGALSSAAVGYAIGQSLGRQALRRIAGKRLGDLSRRLAKRGLIAMLVVRLLPVAPYTVINLVAGASSIGWRDYLFGTALGLLPGLVMITALVDRAVVAIRTPSAASVSILVVVVAIFLTAGWLLHRKFREPPVAACARRPGDDGD